jgi:hypothetical protein
MQHRWLTRLCQHGLSTPEKSPTAQLTTAKYSTADASLHHVTVSVLPPPPLSAAAQGDNKGYLVCKKKMATSAEMLCRYTPPAFRSFTEGVVNQRFDEEPRYEAYMRLFEPLCGPGPQRPILTEGANKVWCMWCTQYSGTRCWPCRCVRCMLVAIPCAPGALPLAPLLLYESDSAPFCILLAAKRPLAHWHTHSCTCNHHHPSLFTLHTPPLSINMCSCWRLLWARNAAVRLRSSLRTQRPRRRCAWVCRRHSGSPCTTRTDL